MTAAAVLHLIHVALVVSLVGSIGYVVGEFIVKRLTGREGDWWTALIFGRRERKAGR